jgi:CRP-like cAMP-binding protein
LCTGDSFGELALISDAMRSSTVRTTSRVNMWGLDRATFQEVLSRINQIYYEESRTFIYSVPLLADLTDVEK